MVVEDKSGKVYDWIVKKLNNKESYKNDLTFAIISDRLFLGGVTYSIDNKICYISIFTENSKWCTRENLTQIFKVPFEQLNCKIAKCMTSDKNKRVNKLLFGLRLRHEGFLRHHRSDGSHSHIFSITKKELKEKKWFKE